MSKLAFKNLNRYPNILYILDYKLKFSFLENFNVLKIIYQNYADIKFFH